MSDAIERLRKQKPVVPSRSVPLSDSSKDKISSISPEEISTPISSNSFQEISQPTFESEMVLERRTMRIETEIDRALDDLCRNNKITRETFLEAALEVAKENQIILNEIINKAQVKYQKRKQIGLKRKTKTMQSKYGN